jgi:hypothetical protein
MVRSTPALSGRKLRLGHPAALALVGALALAACQAPSAPVGTSATPATYTLGVLSLELPPRYDVLAALTAVEVTLRDRGYTVTHRTANADRAALQAQGAPGSLIPDVSVTIRQTAGGTGLEIKTGLFGDEVESRVLAEAFLARLGL